MIKVRDRVRLVDAGISKAYQPYINQYAIVTGETTAYYRVRFEDGYEPQMYKWRFRKAEEVTLF